MRAPRGDPRACSRGRGAAAFRAAARKVTGPGPRVPRRQPRSGPDDTWPHIPPAPPLTSQHSGAAARTHGDAAAEPRGVPGCPPAAAPSAASSSPPQTPTRGGAELLAEGGRRRRLQGLTKPDGATRRYLYAKHVVMETHQLKPAAIGSGREARGRGGDSVAANPGPGAGGGKRGPGPSVGRSAARAHPPAHPPALPARPRAGYALRQARARAPQHQSRLPACRRALWAAGGSRPVHAHMYLVVCLSPSSALRLLTHPLSLPGS